MSNVYKNLTVKNITVNDRTNQYILTVTEPSIFDPENGIDHEVTLWSRRDGKVSEDSIKQTQELLRKELKDETIIFTDPSQDTSDKNHLIHWLKAHPDAQVANCHIYNGYFNLGEPLSGGGAGGGSNFLNSYNPEKDGLYDPTKHRVGVYDALPEATQEIIKSQEGSGVTKTKAGNVTLSHHGRIKDVIFDNALSYDDKGVNHTRESLKEIVEKADPTLVKGLPKDFAYSELIKAIGGYKCENIKGEMERTFVEQKLKESNRRVLAFYIEDLDTHRIYRTTRAMLPSTKDMYDYAYGFEYLNNDFTQRDFIEFIKMILNLSRNPGLGLTQNMIYETLEEAELFDPVAKSLNIHTDADALKALQALFKGRESFVEIGLVSRKGKRDLDKLGSRLQRVGDYINETKVLESQLPDLETQPVEETKPVEEVKEKEEPTAPTSEATLVEDGLTNPFDN